MRDDAQSELDAFDIAVAGRRIDDEANHQWCLARHPQGNVQPHDFAWKTSDIPTIGRGEVLLKTRYLGLAPVMRMYMQTTGAAGEPALRPGDVIHGRGVAQIIQSRHPSWAEGALVQGQLGWQTWKASAMTTREKFFRMPPNGLPAVLGSGVLGMTGLSAHAGFFACGDPRPGDRLLLSGAAGGVGSMVSQMAANVVGCDVTGIAGGAEKCARILKLGCRRSIDYKDGDLQTKIAEAMPDGIDLYFDNVGGHTLELCLERLRLRSRVVLCGSISEYMRDQPFLLSNYTRLRRTDSRMQGFFVYNHLDRWSSVMDELASWIRDGRLTPVQDVIDGFQNMPKALARLYHGRNVGIQCCSVRGEPSQWQ